MSNNKELLLAGKISSPHGIKGMLKVYSYLSSPENFGIYKKFYDSQGQEIKIKHHFAKKTFAIVELNDITDRNIAEQQKDKEIFIDKAELSEADEGEFYHDELVGLKILHNKTKEELGEVISVHNYGAGDILEVKMKSGKQEMFSFDEKTFPEIDLKKSILYLNRPEIDYAG